MTATDQNSINTVAKGGACLVDWELYGTRVTPDELRAKLQAHGFDPAIVPDINQAQRIRTAGGRWTMGRGNADRFRSEVTEDDHFIYVQILRRGNDGTVRGTAARRKFVPVASLVWDKQVECWESEIWWKDGQRTQQAADGAITEAVTACRQVCDLARLHHDHQFIRPVLIQAPLFALGAVPFIRRAGGAMVVPMQNWEQLKQLQGFVSSIGDSYMGVVKADVQDKGTVKAMQRSVRDSLTSDVQAVRDDLRAWRERGHHLRTSAIGDRLTKFSEIADRAQLYADALGMVVTDLLADVDAAKAEARELLDIAMGRKPASAATEATAAA